MVSRTQVIKRNPEAWPLLLKDGCDVSDHCARCPLRVCRLDDGAWFRLAVAWARDRMIVDLLLYAGANRRQVGLVFGLTTRSIKRALVKVELQPEWLTPAELAALKPLVRTAEGD